jgi:DNA transposition AAA+ family ATPase
MSEDYLLNKASLYKTQSKRNYANENKTSLSVDLQQIQQAKPKIQDLTEKTISANSTKISNDSK